MRFTQRARSSRLFNDAASLATGQSIRLVIQAIYFILIARSLGPRGYGAIVAVTALAAVLSPFSALGSPNLFIKNVKSGKREARLCWGNGLVLTVVSGLVLGALVGVVNSAFQLKIVPLVLISVALSDLILMRIIDLVAFGLAAAGRMKEVSLQFVLISLLRLIAVAVLNMWMGRLTVRAWCIAYLVTSVLATIVVVMRASELWGTPRVSFRALREDAFEGFFFSISISAQTIYNDIDKTMLARLSDAGSTGIYGAAYRLIDMCMTPVRSLISAAYPEFFRLGTEGISATCSYAWRLIRRTAIYGLAIFLLLMITAPFVPLVLGPKYLEVVPALRWLALIPFLRCIHLFFADALSGAGYQNVRAAVQVLVAVLNIGLNLIVLPRWSWRGAAWTSIGCDAALVICFWLALAACRRRSTAVLAIAT